MIDIPYTFSISGFPPSQHQSCQQAKIATNYTTCSPVKCRSGHAPHALIREAIHTSLADTSPGISVITCCNQLLQDLSLWRSQTNVQYPLVNKHSYGKSPLLMGKLWKTHYKWPFSMAMLVITRWYNPTENPTARGWGICRSRLWEQWRLMPPQA